MFSIDLFLRNFHFIIVLERVPCASRPLCLLMISNRWWSNLRMSKPLLQPISGQTRCTGTCDCNQFSAGHQVACCQIRLAGVDPGVKECRRNVTVLCEFRACTSLAPRTEDKSVEYACVVPAPPKVVSHLDHQSHRPDVLFSPMLCRKPSIPQMVSQVLNNNTV